MRTKLIAAVAAGWLTTLVAAQKTATAEFDELRAALGKAQRAHVAAYQEQVEKAKAAGSNTVPAFSFDGVMADFVPKFQDAATRYAGTDDALPFLQFLLGTTTGDAKEAVLATLLRDHIDSAKLGSAVAVLGQQRQALGDERVRELLGKILAANPHADVKANALIARASSLLDQDASASPEQRAAALTDIESAHGLAADPALKARAEGILFEQQHLQIGQTAPDIEGTDLAGVAFKLSDYRGKVVLLDFWGDW